MNANTSDYVIQAVEGVDPVHLVELLFQRAVRDLETAKEAWGSPPQSPETIRLVVHAQSIITELHHCLNYEEGGRLARDLGRLYEYMQYRLMESVTSVSEEGLQALSEVLNLLSSLSDAWCELSRRQADLTLVGAQADGKFLVA